MTHLHRRFRAFFMVAAMTVVMFLVGASLDIFTRMFFHSGSSFSMAMVLPVCALFAILAWAGFGAPAALRSIGADLVRQSLSAPERSFMSVLQAATPLRGSYILWVVQSEDPNVALLAPPGQNAHVVVTTGLLRDMSRSDMDIVVKWLGLFLPWARWFFWLSAPLAMVSFLSRPIASFSNPRRRRRVASPVFRPLAAFFAMLVVWPVYQALKMLATPWSALEVDSLFRISYPAQVAGLADLLRRLGWSRASTVTRHAFLPQAWIFDPVSGAPTASALPPRLALTHPPLEMRLSALEGGVQD